MSERTLSYSRPADVLQLMHRKAGGKPADFEEFVAKHCHEFVSDGEAGF